MKTRAQFYQSGDASLLGHFAFGGLCNSGDQFQDGGLAGAVEADDTQSLTWFHGKTDVLQGPKVPPRSSSAGSWL